MVDLITDVIRTKRSYRVSWDEFRNGSWLDLVEPSAFLELEYIGKSNILVIKDMKPRRLGDEMLEDFENGRGKEV